MVAFLAPGGSAKYRLGNEAETFGEMIFVNNWINPSRDPEEAWMRTELLIEANTSQSSNYSNNDEFRFRAAFIQMGNILASNPGARFSAGERYHRRQNIDIDNFYVLDMSGYGGGVEDLNVKVGQIAIAYLGGARDDLVTNIGPYPKSNLDARLYDVRGPYGEWGAWHDYSFPKGGTVSNGQTLPSMGGVHLRNRPRPP